MIVHRKTEQYREEEQRREGLDGLDLAEAQPGGDVLEDRRPDALLEEEDDHAVGRSDREQIHGDRLQWDDQRAERHRQQLFIGAATVKSHVSSILTELGLRDRAQVVVFAYESGLVEIGERDIGH